MRVPVSVYEKECECVCEHVFMSESVRAWESVSARVPLGSTELSTEHHCVSEYDCLSTDSWKRITQLSSNSQMCHMSNTCHMPGTLPGTSGTKMRRCSPPHPTPPRRGAHNLPEADASPWAGHHAVKNRTGF